MKRPLLFLMLVLVLCVGGGLALRTRALPDAAGASRIESHLADEIAMLHKVAEELVAMDLRFPRYDHRAGNKGFRKRVDAFYAKTAEIEALGSELSHPALMGARVVHKEGGGHRFEIWLLGKDPLSAAWSISPSRASLGKPSVHRMHGGEVPMVSYSAVGATTDGSTPGIEILVDLDWLLAHTED